MFNLEKAIKEWKKSLRKNEALEDGYIAELESHLRDEVEKALGFGKDEEVSFNEAIKKLGETDTLGEEYYKTDTTHISKLPPWKESKWMPAVISKAKQRIWESILIKNYFIVGLRVFKKNKSFSLLNITGLAVGIACAILIYQWVQDELSYDKFHENADQLYVAAFSNGSTTTPTALADNLKAEYPEVNNTSRYIDYGKGMLKYENINNVEKGGVFTDPGFLQMFAITFINGSKNSSLNAPRSIVISKKLAEKYFGSINVIGKTLTFENDYPLIVTGVFQEYPLNSHIQFEYIIPFSLLKEFGVNINNWGTNLTRTYVQLKKAIQCSEFNLKVANIAGKHRPSEKRQLSLQLVTKMHLHNLDNTVGAIKYIYIYSAMAAFILVIGCINFMNLNTAKSAKRSKEVGLRKVIGANRSDLVLQFFTESFIMTSFSVFIGIILSVALLPVFNELTGKQYTYEFIFKPTVIVGILGITIITGFLAGSYPAIVLSGFQPIKVLRGNISTGMKGSAFRKILVVTQFSLSIFLLACTFTIYRQTEFMRNKDLGLNKDNIIYTSIGNKFITNYETIRSEILKNPNITDVTLTNIAPYTKSINAGSGDIKWEGKTNQDFSMTLTSVDHDYLKTFNLRMSSGRYFSKDYSSDINDALVINEAAAKAMGMDSPIGKELEVLRWKGKIIGVINDYHYESLRTQISPMVMKVDPSMYNQLCVRISPNNISGSIAFLQNKWNEIYPDRTFEYSFLDETIKKLYNTEETVGKTAKCFTFLALIISCFGLLGLASYATEQRKKEIGIRKTLGASITGLIFLLNKEFTKWVLLANLIAWPAAYLFAQSWLKDFEYRADFSIWVFVASGLLALVIALLSVCYQAIKAAAANPVNSLRSE